MARWPWDVESVTWTVPPDTPAAAPSTTHGQANPCEQRIEGIPTSQAQQRGQIRTAPSPQAAPRRETREKKTQDTCASNRPVKASVLRQRAAVAITQCSQFGCHVAVSPAQEPLQKLARCSLHLQPHEPSSSRSPVRQPGTVTVNSRFYGRDMQQPNTRYDMPKEPATRSVRGWQR